MKPEQKQLSALDKLAIARTEDLEIPVTNHPEFKAVWDCKARAFNALSELLMEANIPVGLLRTAIDEAVNYERLANPGIYKQGYLGALKDLQQMIASGNLGASAWALITGETA